MSEEELEEMEDLKQLASTRDMTVEELIKYREYSSRSLNGEEWIEYLKLCEKVWRNPSKYLYIYEHEIKEINKYIDKLQQENKQYQEEVSLLDMRTDENIKLKNNWNELKKWLEYQHEHTIQQNNYGGVLNKMQELEVNNE